MDLHHYGHAYIPSCSKGAGHAVCSTSIRRTEGYIIPRGCSAGYGAADHPSGECAYGWSEGYSTEDGMQDVCSLSVSLSLRAVWCSHSPYVLRPNGVRVPTCSLRSLGSPSSRPSGRRGALSQPSAGLRGSPGTDYWSPPDPIWRY